MFRTLGLNYKRIREYNAGHAEQGDNIVKGPKSKNGQWIRRGPWARGFWMVKKRMA